MDVFDIYKRANKLVKTYETDDPFKLAKLLGIEIREEKLGSLKGFYTCVLKNRYIILNEDNNDEDQRTVCMHELWHDQRHRGLGITMFKEESCVSLKTSTPEIEANFLTAESLISDYRFLELAAEGFTYSQIASTIIVNKDLVAIKAQLLSMRGHKINVPYIPTANFLGKKSANHRLQIDLR